MRRIGFLFIVVLGCHKQPPPSATWSALRPLATHQPISGVSCGVRGRSILIDQSPGLVTLDHPSRSFALETAPGPRIERANGALVLQGADLIDVETGTHVPAPKLSIGPDDRWSESTDGKTFAYEQGLMPDLNNVPSTRIEVFGAHHWTLEIPDNVSTMRLSNDGSLLAVVVAKHGDARLELIRDGKPLSGSIDLGKSTSDLLVFDDSDHRIAAIRYLGNGAGNALVVASDAGVELQQIPLGAGAGASSGSIDNSGFRGDGVWVFSGGHAGHGLQVTSVCSYTHVALDSKRITTERDFLDEFGPTPERTCDIRAICGTGDGGLIVLRHDMNNLTVESWAKPF